MAKALHCITVSLSYGEDSYDHVSFLPSATEAALDFRGARLMGMEVSRRKVKEGQILFSAKVSDGDRTERDGMTQDDLLVFAEDMELAEPIVKWLEQHAEVIGQGVVPPALQIEPPGYSYCVVEAYKAKRSQR